jgi:magnesium-protoporphyrin IX monomethyl ester (oxidative) cyclase
MVDVCLVSMPFASLERPSLALGLLTASAGSQGLEAEAIYPTFDFARVIGVELYRAIADGGDTAELVGEWVFSGAAFPEHTTDGSEYFDWALREDWYTVWQYRALLGAGADLRALVRKARAAAGRFVDEVAAEILARRPRIVGCSSVFQQHCASLALLRRVKAADPSIVTLLGGGNCEGPMAAVAVRSFPWVDYVVSGEADLLFPHLCKLALEHGGEIPRALLPASVRARRRSALPMFESSSEVPREQVDDMDSLPLPRFEDYFRTFARHADLGLETPRLLIETSRGCWYGQLHHCTFCGLNGGGMKFRSKSPDRVVAELAALSDAHGIVDFEAVDNILDHSYFETLLPRLAADATRRYSLFFETKSNLTERHIVSLAAAGITRIQPGIESFHDAPLRLMDKGNNGAQNVALLKFAQEHGVGIAYNLLFGMPGEDESWYVEMARWLPRIFHLEPPGTLARVRYDRFSPYHQNPARFGIHLEPNRAYRHIYPLPPGDLAELAYFFEDYTDTTRGRVDRPAYARLWELWKEWVEVYGAQLRTGTGSMLMAVEDEDETTLLDRRPGARQRMVELRGLSHRLYRACRQPRTRRSLLEKMAGESAESIDDAASVLLEAGFLVEVCGKLIAVAPQATSAMVSPA